MARRSQWEEYKPRVWQSFNRGVIPAQIIAKFGVAKSTAYDWHKDWKRGKPAIPEPRRHPSPPHPVSGVYERKVIEKEEELSDFALAEKVLRAIASGEEHPNVVRVQACLGLIRLAQMQAELPSHILYGGMEATVVSERKNLESTSAQELWEEYKRLLEAT